MWAVPPTQKGSPGLSGPGILKSVPRGHGAHPGRRHGARLETVWVFTLAAPTCRRQRPGPASTPSTQGAPARQVASPECLQCRGKKHGPVGVVMPDYQGLFHPWPQDRASWHRRWSCPGVETGQAGRGHCSARLPPWPLPPLSPRSTASCQDEPYEVSIYR